MSSPETWTLEELIAYLDKCDVCAYQDYKTTRQWAEILGVSVDRMRQIIAKASEKGLVERKRVPIINIAGYHSFVIGYRFITEGDERNGT